MKVVIVLDTEDAQGMRDAYNIARSLYLTKGKRFHASTTTVKVNKIQFIKTLREFGAEAVDEFCDKFDVSRTPAAVRWKPSLKLSKQAVDIYFDENA